MIESDRKMFQLTLFGLGVALALNTGSAAATERDCVDSATAIILEIAEKVDPSNGRIDARREAQKLCSLRISPQMREAAARDALNEFFPKEARNYQYLGQIPGLNIYSPSTVIFSKRKGLRIDFRKIVKRLFSGISGESPERLTNRTLQEGQISQNIDKILYIFNILYM